jgi:hypothetical protein
MRGEEKVGPVTQEALCDLFGRGILTLQTMVFNEAFGKWTAASSIAALRAICPVKVLKASEADDSLGTLNYEIDPPTEADLVGIGGWLLLPAIGLVIGPVINGFVISWLWGLARIAATRGAAPVANALQLLAAFSALFLLYQVVAAVLFYTKKKSAPSAMVGLYVGMVLLNFVYLLKTRQFMPNFGRSISDWYGMAKPLAIALVWIPYFLASQRVKRTFVN